MLLVAGFTIFRVLSVMPDASRRWLLAGSGFCVLAISLDLLNSYVDSGVSRTALWPILICGSAFLMIGSRVVDKPNSRIEHYNSLLNSLGMPGIVISKQTIVAANDLSIRMPHNAGQLLGSNAWDIWRNAIQEPPGYEVMLAELNSVSKLTRTFDYRDKKGRESRFEIEIAVIDYSREEFLVTISDAREQLRSDKKIAEW